MEHVQHKYSSPSPRDAILPLFRLGQKVRLIKDIRNDGTFAFAPIGEILVHEGSIGYVRHMGDFLQVIRVYDIDFIDSGKIFGCREEELESVDDDYNEVEEELRWLKEHREKRSMQRANPPN